MTKVCEVCGKPLLNATTEKCLECSRKALQKLFKENPDLAQAYKETIEELRRPENIQKMADSTVKVMQMLQALRGMSPEERAKLLDFPDCWNSTKKGKQ